MRWQLFMVLVACCRRERFTPPRLLLPRCRFVNWRGGRVVPALWHRGLLGARGNSGRIAGAGAVGRRPCSFSKPPAGVVQVW